MSSNKSKSSIWWIIALVILIIARNVDITNIDFSSTNYKSTLLIFIILIVAIVIIFAFIKKEKDE